VTRSRPSLFVAALLVAAGPSFAARVRSNGPIDHALGCDIGHLAARPWTAAGLAGVTGGDAHKFKLLKSLTGTEPAADLQRACAKWPSIGAKAFIKKPGGGGITRADIVVATEDITVYRAYSDGPFKCSIAKPAEKLGSWWALSPFPSDKASYRKSMAVCDSWNDFTRRVACTLKAGTLPHNGRPPGLHQHLRSL
jgi:hypothetical protein